MRLGIGLGITMQQRRRGGGGVILVLLLDTEGRAIQDSQNKNLYWAITPAQNEANP